MILDQWENALRYLGISPELDLALRFLSGLNPGQLAVNTRVELQGSDVFYTVSEPLLSARAMTFEFHRRYTDIHVPVTARSASRCAPPPRVPPIRPLTTRRISASSPGMPSIRSRCPSGGSAYASRRTRTFPVSAARRNTPSSSWCSRSGHPEPGIT